MKHTILKKAGAALLIAGLTFALPAYAEMHGGTDAMGMDEKGTTDAQQMSGMMHDMSGEMNEMSGMMGKGTMMDADMQKQMGPMRKQMDRMRKNMPLAPAKK
jgi:hypothetical protein